MWSLDVHIWRKTSLQYFHGTKKKINKKITSLNVTKPNMSLSKIISSGVTASRLTKQSFHVITSYLPTTLKPSTVTKPWPYNSLVKSLFSNTLFYIPLYQILSHIFTFCKSIIWNLWLSNHNNISIVTS